MKKLFNFMAVALLCSGMVSCDENDEPQYEPEYQLRVLTFEDSDYKGTGNYLGNKDWSSLIDVEQNNGALLYPKTQELYRWEDENNTFLASELVNKYGDYQYWGGGHAVSSYVDMDMPNCTFEHQLSVCYQDSVSGFGGHNGSKNFCVHNGYDASVEATEGLPSIYFSDGTARVIDHMYVIATTYFLRGVKLGNSPSRAFQEGDVCKLIATGVGADGAVTGTAEFVLAQDADFVVNTWTKFDLSSLGKVVKVYFNMTSTDTGEWGMNTPAYFAYDDVAVRFE